MVTRTRCWFLKKPGVTTSRQLERVPFFLVVFAGTLSAASVMPGLLLHRGNEKILHKFKPIVLFGLFSSQAKGRVFQFVCFCHLLVRASLMSTGR